MINKQILKVAYLQIHLQCLCLLYYLHTLLTTYPNAHISHLNHAHIIGSITLNDTLA